MIETADLERGDLIAFCIRAMRFSASPFTGKWGAARVLAVRDGMPVVCVLDGLWQGAPTAEDALASVPLVPMRDAGSVIWDMRAYDIAAFMLAWTPRIPDAQVIARDTPLSPAETDLLTELEAHTFATEQSLFYGPLSNWDYPSEELAGEAWFREDRAAWEADRAEIAAKWQAKIEAEELRKRTRLKGLRISTLLAETPLPGFGDPLPAAFVAEARARVHATTEALATLGPRPRRPAVRKELKALVLWFNDREAHIETVEREALYQQLEELCWAAGQKALVPEIVEWRSW